MTLKALPHDVRSILCASAQINNYKTAIAELVYNSLDAESTSIAIRVHIQENRIQVIDNGRGIMKNDFDSIGQKYMTSKITDIITLKSMPKFYGFRGEFLANLIEISQCVTIISRYKESEETWAQIFYKGKRKQLAKMTTRPSKGTTIEVKGFLYNLNIQKQAIDPLNDLQNIKTFLEQLSVVHNDISLSLRDDSKNEIIFKIHKKRDIYQTLSSLFDINQSDVQELQIEKNNYKVQAFIGKSDKIIERRWIYLNGKSVPNSSKLHKLTNEYLKKYLCLTGSKKSKCRNNNMEEHLLKTNVPFYFILITCPYADYDFNSTSRHSVVDFKNWKQLQIILEKLIKFYVGDITLKEVKNTKENSLLHKTNNEYNHDIQHEIDKIVEKVLGSNLKNIGTSQLQNGVKGKLIKRRIKNKMKEVNCNKLFPNKNKTAQLGDDIKSLGRPEKNRTPKNKRPEHLVLKKKDSNSIKSTVTKEPVNKIITEKARETKIKSSDFKIKSRKIGTINEKKNKYKTKTKNKILPKVVAKSIQNSISKHIANNRQDTNPIASKSTVTKEPVNKIITEKARENKIRSSDFKIKSRKIGTINEKKKKHKAKTKNKILPKLVDKSIQNSICKHIATNRQDTNRIAYASGHLAQNNKISSKNYYKYFNTKDDIINNQKMKTFIKNKYQSIYNNLSNYTVHKWKTNPFQTTYDLVQTILQSQQDRKNDQNDNSLTIERKDRIKHRQNYNESSTKTGAPLNHGVSPGYNYSYSQEQRQTFDAISINTSSKREYLKLFNDIKNFSTDRQYKITDTYNYHNIASESTYRSLRCKDILKLHSERCYTQSNKSSYLSDIQTVSALTYESHNYNEHYQNIWRENRQTYLGTNRNCDYFPNKAQRSRFITKQSKDNFVSSDNKYLSKKYLKNKNNGSRTKQSQFYSKYIKQTIDESYTIEFTTSNGMSCLSKQEQTPVENQYDFTRPIVTDTNKSICNSFAIDYEPTMNFGNTYTIPTSGIYSSCNLIQNAKRTISHSVFACNSIHYPNTCSDNENAAMSKENNVDKGDNNFVLISEPECIEYDVTVDDIQPINLCETVFNENESIQKEIDLTLIRSHRSSGSLYDNLNNKANMEENPTKILRLRNTFENTSHHFTSALQTDHLLALDEINIQSPVPVMRKTEEVQNTNGRESQNLKECHCENNQSYDDAKFIDNNFNFKDRLRFLPKGMSQIFAKCGSKAICDYNLDKDYYEDEIYNDFANDIEMQTEVYEPGVQNVEDITTRDMQNFKTKVHKDRSSLNFNERSLNEAQVLNQVDCKFIAAIIRGRCRELELVSDYLILFDQHAVHERIRLEKNLEDYFSENRWKNVPLDNITLKMSKDEILYMHNYKDKFNQLGLQWSVLENDEVVISSIPEAILGKNPREVDKVMKAVKNLIVEEINAIKLQKGCISLYPKSIMDLVFSEACRYAIKFGDKLSKSDCIDLINDLSKCKTPFQCAHGRPVMAVLVDVKNENRDYKIDYGRLNFFKQNRKMHGK